MTTGNRKAWERKRILRLVTKRIVVPLTTTLPPTALKLWAWTLVDYDACLLLDTDMLVLRPLWRHFPHVVDNPADKLIMAHHPTDLLQSQCGLPPLTRGLACVIGLLPNMDTFHSLTAWVEHHMPTRHLQYYADQMGVMCFFSNGSSTTIRILPAHTVYHKRNRYFFA